MMNNIRVFAADLTINLTERKVIREVRLDLRSELDTAFTNELP